MEVLGLPPQLIEDIIHAYTPTRLALIDINSTLVLSPKELAVVLVVEYGDKD